MPAMIEPEDIKKIEAAKILGLRTLDQADSLPYGILEYVDNTPGCSIKDILNLNLISREELVLLGATKVL